MTAAAAERSLELEDVRNYSDYRYKSSIGLTEVVVHGKTAFP